MSDPIEDAVARLDELEGRPVSEHVGIYEQVHSALQDQLAAASDEEAGGTASADPSTEPSAG